MTNLVKGLFLQIFELSVYASIILLCILAIKLLFNKKLSPKINYTIWLLALIKLTIPFELQSPLSIHNYVNIPAWENVKHRAIPVAPDDKKMTPLTDTMHSVNTLPTTSEVTNIPITTDLGSSNTKTTMIAFEIGGTTIDLIEFIAYGWLFVTLLLIISGLFRYSRFVKRLKLSACYHDSNLNDLLDETSRTLKLKRHPQILTCDYIKSPILLGIFQPRVYLPENLVQRISSQQLRHILLHELGHYRRLDIVTLYVLFFVRCFYWFNPLIWFSSNIVVQDMELACDFLVLSYLPKDETVNYGYTLLEVARFQGSKNKTALSTGFFINKHHFKKRIFMISNFKKDSKLIAALTVIIALILGSITLTSAMPDESNVNEPPEKGMVPTFTAEISSTLIPSPTEIKTFVPAPDEIVFDEKAGSYKGITRGDSYATVIKKLGTPTSIENQTIDIWSWKQLYYPNVKVTLMDQQANITGFAVTAITVTNDKVTTLKGIRVGDSVEAFTKAYGTPDMIVPGDVDGEVHAYENICSNGNTLFHVKNGKIDFYYVCGSF